MHSRPCLRRREREEEAHREAERQRRVALLKEARAWRRATLLREYVAAVRAESACGGQARDSRVEEWAAWALGVAGEMDPIGKEGRHRSSERDRVTTFRSKSVSFAETVARARSVMRQGSLRCGIRAHLPVHGTLRSKWGRT
jgi:hypothetical protein